MQTKKCGFVATGVRSEFQSVYWSISCILIVQQL